MMLMQQQQQQQQAGAAAGGFSPPPNVTAPAGMDNPMGAPNMGQPGPQQFGYGGNYGESVGSGAWKAVAAPCWWLWVLQGSSARRWGEEDFFQRLSNTSSSPQGWVSRETLPLAPQVAVLPTP